MTTSCVNSFIKLDTAVVPALAVKTTVTEVTTVDLTETQIQEIIRSYLVAVYGSDFEEATVKLQVQDMYDNHLTGGIIGREITARLTTKKESTK